MNRMLRSYHRCAIHHSLWGAVEFNKAIVGQSGFRDDADLFSLLKGSFFRNGLQTNYPNVAAKNFSEFALGNVELESIEFSSFVRMKESELRLAYGEICEKLDDLSNLPSDVAKSLSISAESILSPFLVGVASINQLSSSGVGLRAVRFEPLYDFFEFLYFTGIEKIQDMEFQFITTLSIYKE